MANHVEGRPDHGVVGDVVADADQETSDVGDPQSASTDDIIARRVEVLAQVSGVLKKLEIRRYAKPAKT
jgi:hypothetical protein